MLVTIVTNGPSTLLVADYTNTSADVPIRVSTRRGDQIILPGETVRIRGEVQEISANETELQRRLRVRARRWRYHPKKQK
jgi:hypothetical protein